MKLSVLKLAAKMKISRPSFWVWVVIVVLLSDRALVSGKRSGKEYLNGFQNAPKQTMSA